MKFSTRNIPAAAAMTAALIFGAQAQAQTATSPTTAAGDKAAVPAGPNTTGKSMQQRDAAGADQPTRQSSKVAKNKAERMEKGTKQKSSMGKSDAPVREAEIKDMQPK